MGRNTKEDIFPCDPNKTEKREMDRTKRDRNREKKKQGFITTDSTSQTMITKNIMDNFMPTNLTTSTKLTNCLKIPCQNC